jgi:transposase-like protein
MSKLKRQYRSNSEKVSIVREHLLDKVPISEVCSKHKIAPSQFYIWQKQLFEQGCAAFGTQGREEKSGKEERKLHKRIEHLEFKLKQREEVVSELMTEHLALKKSLGEI